MLDRVGLVVLYAYVSLVDSKSQGQNVGSDEHFGSPLQHDAMVRRQERFAFHSVDDQKFGFFPYGDRELDMRGESGSPHADDPCIFNARYDLVASQMTFFN